MIRLRYDAPAFNKTGTLHRIADAPVDSGKEGLGAWELCRVGDIRNRNLTRNPNRNPNRINRLSMQPNHQTGGRMRTARREDYDSDYD